MVSMGGGSWLMMVCITILGPPTGVLVVSWGAEMGPLPTIMPENGSRFAPAMGLDGAVCRFGSDWYDYEYELEVVWHSDGVEGHREWCRWCWFKDPKCGGSPLRHEEEHGGSVVFSWYVNW